MSGWRVNGCSVLTHGTCTCDSSIYPSCIYPVQGLWGLQPGGRGHPGQLTSLSGQSSFQFSRLWIVGVNQSTWRKFKQTWEQTPGCQQIWTQYSGEDVNTWATVPPIMEKMSLRSFHVRNPPNFLEFCVPVFTFQVCYSLADWAAVNEPVIVKHE